MSITINAFSNEEWERHGLAEFGDFADQIAECNIREERFSGYGEWFYVPDKPLPNGDRVIYFGSWSKDTCPGASIYTNADIFDGNDPDDLSDFALRVRHLESQPEYDEQS
jgi:hypothetical protein